MFVLTLNRFHNLVNPLTLGGKEKVIHTQTKLHLKVESLFKHVWSSVTTAH